MVTKQENGKTVHEDHIISSLHTQEQIRTNMKRQGNVDCQLKSIVGVPQTAFAEKHGLHTQSVN
jgi:hypothetical protein